MTLPVPTSAKRLPAPVLILAGVSFLNEASAQMVAPLIPILLASVLAAGPVALGIVEGCADAVAAYVKLWMGRRADMAPHQRKATTLLGYSLSLAARPLMALAPVLPVVAGLRSIDRLGKGIRGAPRDALIADATPAGMRGRAFGVQRAMDYAGAVCGTLIAAAVLAASAVSIQDVILLSAIPGIAVVLLLAWMPSPALPPSVPSAAGATVAVPWQALPPPLRRYLSVLALLCFARSSEAFLLLRGHELGISTIELLLLWAMLATLQTVAALIGAPVTDRMSKRSLTLMNWATLGLGYAALALVQTPMQLWAAVALYGAMSGMTEGVERSYVSELGASMGTGGAFGWYHMVTGAAAIPAGILFGSLWHVGQAAAAFGFAAAVALTGAVLLWSLPIVPGKR